MSWVSDIADIVDGYARFTQVVQYYENGLCYRNGIPKPVRIKWPEEKKAEFAELEREAERKHGKDFLPFRLMPWFRPDYGEGFRHSLFFGRARREERYEKSKILLPGRYYHLPIFTEIDTGNVTLKVVDLDNISVAPRVDGSNESIWADLKKSFLAEATPPGESLERAIKIVDLGARLLGQVERSPILVSCQLRYRVNNLLKAETCVEDYENAICKHALAVLALAARYARMEYDDWRNPEKIDELQDLVLRGKKPEKKTARNEREQALDEERDEVEEGEGARNGGFKGIRHLATRSWGLTIDDFVITDSPHHRVLRHLLEGSGLYMTADNGE